MKEKMILISGAVVYRRQKGEKPVWFIVKQNGSENWEIPKTAVRRGESSVRAVLRIMGEQGGMRTKVFEEIGRGTGSSTVAGRPIPQQFIYYLMFSKDEGNVLGYEETDWVDHNKLIKRLASKREISIATKAKDLLAELDKRKKEKKKAAAKIAAESKQV